MHDPAKNQYSLLIRAARIGNTNDTICYARSDYGFSRDMPNAGAFYPTRLRLTRPGVWLLVATSAPIGDV